MERWDLYDDNRQKVGQSILRGDPIPKSLHHLVVGVWTVNSHGKILLTLRHPQKQVYPNTWENSGGAAQMGEESRQAAVRELREETGIQAAPEELIPLGTEKRDGAFVDSYLIHRDISLLDLQMQEGETTDARWATPGEIEALCQEEKMARPVARRWYQLKDQILTELKRGRME